MAAMFQYQPDERDWKTFRKNIPMWQEKYISTLIEEYKTILSENENSSEKFWKLKERIDTDVKKKGVIIEMKRSILVNNLINLIDEAVIDIDDLNEFSDELKEKVLSSIIILNRTRELYQRI